MKKVTLAVLAFATLGMAAVPALAQDDATIFDNTQESINTGNYNRNRNTSIQQNIEDNEGGGNRGTVFRNRQLCDNQGDSNDCENTSVQQNNTRRNNRR